MANKSETTKAAEAGATRQIHPRKQRVLNRSPRGVYKGTREEWLEDAMHIMGQWVNEWLADYSKAYDVGHVTNLNALVRKYGGKPSDYKFNPRKVKVSVSLQDGGMMKSRAMAHVHYAHATGNNFHEIRMSVELGGRKYKADSMRVADILLHEMIHTCAVFHGHRRAFRDIALGVGLTGKMTSTYATDVLAARIKSEVVDVLGKYPHRKVTLIKRGQRGKGSRLIKCVCPTCEFNFRTTRKWINKAQGSLACPIGCGEMITIGYTYTGEGEGEE